MMRTTLPIKSIGIWAMVAFASVLLLVVGLILFLQTQSSPKVYDFQTCKNAGGALLESYPEKCMLNGKSFVNESQAGKENDYIGLTEQAAMDKAKNAGLPHRVVERDDESLAVTMDYVMGRLNFHVRDGHVYRVEIEGVE